MKNLLLTLDAGTSSCKAEVFTPEGESVSAGSVAYRVHSPGPGRAELDPTVLTSAAKTAVGKALTGIDTAELAGMGVSAQLGLAALDRDGRLLGNILTWADRRAAEQAERIEATLGPEKIYAGLRPPRQPGMAPSEDPLLPAVSPRATRRHGKIRIAQGLPRPSTHRRIRHRPGPRFLLVDL